MLRTAALISLAALTLPTPASALSNANAKADIPEKVTYAGGSSPGTARELRLLPPQRRHRSDGVDLLR